MDSRHSRIRSNLDLLWDLLGEAGVAERADAETTTTEWGTPHRSGGVVALTRLGYGLLADPLRAAGFDIPEVGLLADGPLDAIVAMVGQWRAPTLTAEFQIWARRRSAEEVGDALCRLVDATSDPEVRLLAIKFAEALEEQQAEATVRTLLDTSARGHAIGWLTEHGCSDVPLDQEAIMRAGVEMFSMFAGGEDDEEFGALVLAIDELEPFIDQIWRIPEPHVGDVLAAIARVHPDPRLAKRARKAVMQHRTNMATRRG